MKKGKLNFGFVVFGIIILFSGAFVGYNAWKEKQETNKYEEFIVVDVFDSLANYQGIQSGWFAQVVKEKFNMELNIIAPNVAGGGDTLYQIRAAAGNLGDIIISGTENGNLQELVDGELLYDMSEALENKQIMQYEDAINSLNSKLEQEGIYAIPSEVSKNAVTVSSEGLELNYGPYMRWDGYKAIGYPTIENMDDLLDVLDQLQEEILVSDTGETTYAFSLFKDWDNNMVSSAKQPACLYGYDEIGFVLAKADGSDYQNIMDKDSLYIQALELYFEANQRGLLDPDSMSQNYQDVYKKYQEGQVLFSFWPWQGQTAYNTQEHTKQGKTFMMIPIEDMEVLSYGCNPEGNQQTVIAVGSHAKDPERLVDFIDWLYSTEGILISGARNNGGTAGPEGLTWELVEGEPYLTEFGKQAFFNTDVTMPEEWGGGTWNSGLCELNYKPISSIEQSEEGYYYYYDLWDSVRESQDNELTKEWQEHMQAETTIEYLEENNQIIIVPGSSYVTPEESEDITTKRTQCKSVIVEYSWKMIFAKDRAEFDRLYTVMNNITLDYGYDTVYALDLKNAMMQDVYRKEALSNNADK